jgi:Penicillin-insensitive murein endopeptidase
MRTRSVRATRRALTAGVAVGVAALAVVLLTATADGEPAGAIATTTAPEPEPEPEAPPPPSPPAAPLPLDAASVDRARGVAIRHPSGWALRTPGLPGLCFELLSRQAGASDGVEIRVAEEHRGRAASAARWTEGEVRLLAVNGRRILVGVVVGPEAPGPARATVETVLATLDIRRSGRCGLPREPIRWRASRAVGLPYAGRLVNGVRLPSEGAHFFTWDPVRRRAPNRGWRRWGTDGVVRTTLRIIRAYAAAHPRAPRVGIGDLSRPRGGDFGPQFGGLGHASHQSGLDVDVYYPRLDRKELSPKTAAQVDRRLAQDLVDRFVAAGAVRVFVGPNVGLTGPPAIVQRLPRHDNHLHARFPRWRA